MRIEHHYVYLLKKKLSALMEFEKKLLPILDDVQSFHSYPEVVQDILFKESQSFGKQIKNIEAKINEYYRASEEERIDLNMVAWFSEEKQRRSSQE
ncbi:hypothetical protein [Ferdinandcohnia sp. Marseille-Q9671]